MTKPTQKQWFVAGGMATLVGSQILLGSYVTAGAAVAGFALAEAVRRTVRRKQPHK